MVATPPMPDYTLTGNAPIVLFAYNRPGHTRQSIEALQQNDLATESDLIIFSDAARNAQASTAVQAVRSYLKTIDGFKSVTIVERSENLGLADSVIDGVTMVCERFGRVIVLEDDLVTSPHFLRYMNDALRFYADDDRVISIHGYIYPVLEPLPPAFFLRGADCWGWATWKRGWDLFDADAKKLYAAIKAGGESKVFDFDAAYGYTDMLKRQVEGQINSWAIRWYASAFLADKLTLYPGVSMVRNIGNDNSGTHSRDTEIFDGQLAQYALSLGGIPVEPSARAYDAVSAYFKSLRPSWLMRVRNRLLSFLRSGAAA
jgi:hypothetical protein